MLPAMPCKVLRWRSDELCLGLQGRKAERKPVSVHVAVVELKHDDPAGQEAVQYVLVRRPATGLLAGMPSLHALIWQSEVSPGAGLRCGQAKCARRLAAAAFLVVL